MGGVPQRLVWHPVVREGVIPVAGPVLPVAEHPIVWVVNDVVHDGVNGLCKCSRHYNAAIVVYVHRTQRRIADDVASVL